MALVLRSQAQQETAALQEPLGPVFVKKQDISRLQCFELLGSKWAHFRTRGD